jgi:hypothetical protein
MPTDHAEVSLRDVRVPAAAVFGTVGLDLAQHFVHENRIRQAASSFGAAQYCIDAAVAYANQRTTWGKRLSSNQAIRRYSQTGGPVSISLAAVHRDAWMSKSATSPRSNPTALASKRCQHDFPIWSTWDGTLNG